VAGRYKRVIYSRRIAVAVGSKHGRGIIQAVVSRVDPPPGPVNMICVLRRGEPPKPGGHPNDQSIGNGDLSRICAQVRLPRIGGHLC
jgi:hypothetical protein